MADRMSEIGGLQLKNTTIPIDDTSDCKGARGIRVHRRWQAGADDPKASGDWSSSGCTPEEALDVAQESVVSSSCFPEEDGNESERDEVVQNEHPGGIHQAMNGGGRAANAGEESAEDTRSRPKEPVTPNDDKDTLDDGCDGSPRAETATGPAISTPESTPENTPRLSGRASTRASEFSWSATSTCMCAVVEQLVHPVAAAAAAAAKAAALAAAAQQPHLLFGEFRFSFTLRLDDDSKLGLELLPLGDAPFLTIQRVLPRGAVQAWNKLCAAKGFAHSKAIRTGDCIVDINGFADCSEMLREMRDKRLLRITVSRVIPGCVALPEAYCEVVAPTYGYAPNYYSEDCAAQASYCAAFPACGSTMWSP